MVNLGSTAGTYGVIVSLKIGFDFETADSVKDHRDAARTEFFSNEVQLLVLYLSTLLTRSSHNASNTLINSADMLTDSSSELGNDSG